MPRSNLSKVAARTRLRGVEAREKMERRVRTAAIETLDSVTANTPVDRGLARSNWQGTLGQPANQSKARPYLEYPQQTNPLKKAETANRDGARQQARRNWLRYTLGMKIFLTNNVDYILALNAGQSSQTEAGFLERAIARGVFAARRIR